MKKSEAQLVSMLHTLMEREDEKVNLMQSMRAHINQLLYIIETSYKVLEPKVNEFNELIINTENIEESKIKQEAIKSILSSIMYELNKSFKNS